MPDLGTHVHTLAVHTTLAANYVQASTVCGEANAGRRRGVSIVQAWCYCQRCSDVEVTSPPPLCIDGTVV